LRFVCSIWRCTKTIKDRFALAQVSREPDVDPVSVWLN